MIDYVIFSSYGNDSVALIQHAKNIGLTNVAVLFSDTGWSIDYWLDRVEKAEEWVRGLGFSTYRTDSIGMEALVKGKMAWPRQGMQFCTLELKIKPALEWLEINDPDRLAVCLTGVRREESDNRKNFLEVVESSPNHGNRKLWSPMVNFTENDRNNLLTSSGFEPLNHRSMECFPCINSNRADLTILAADEKKIIEIERIEKEMGFTKLGKPRTMFRPYRHMGATGIRKIVKWALSSRGKFDPDDGTGDGCDSGFCGL